MIINWKIKGSKGNVVRSDNTLLAYFQKYGFNAGKSNRKGVDWLKYKLNELSISYKSLKYLSDILICKLSVMNNPEKPLHSTNTEFITRFEAYAHSLGVQDIGYTKIVPGLLFKDNEALYPNVIVFTLEMDKDKMSTAPSKIAFEMIHGTYSRLNTIAILMATYLRKNGYGAQASPATLGMAHYPPLAEMAGLGCRGWHGLLITPSLGPRQRIAVIFTSIEDLPFAEHNGHLWIADFCKKCHKCVHECPASAIPSELVLDEYGHQKHLDSQKCVAYFSQNYGCSVCIKKCTFNVSSYDKIKRSFQKNQEAKP